MTDALSQKMHKEDKTAREVDLVQSRVNKWKLSLILEKETSRVVYFVLSY
jgi:hypothetical protein